MAFGWIAAFAVGLATLFVATGLHVDAPGAPQGPSLTTVSGTVTSVAWNPHFAAAPEFIMKNGTTNISVSVGPPWFWAEHNFTPLQTNESVKVQGVLENGSMTAWTVWINGGSAIVLRTGPTPLWADERSGRS